MYITNKCVMYEYIKRLHYNNINKYNYNIIYIGIINIASMILLRVV